MYNLNPRKLQTKAFINLWKSDIHTSFFDYIRHFGLRDKFSNEETASAYSVFNENQQAIQGSFTGTQLDRQLRGGLKQNEMKSSIPTALLEKTKNSRVNENERLRRRNAAALAAEQRLKTQKQQD